MDLAGNNENSALTHGLEILRFLAEAGRPMTSTQIAEKIGLHQSTASRILKTLINAGYVRKPDYRSFAVDLGVLTLGGSAIRHFPSATRPLGALSKLVEKCPALQASIATLWRGQLIYFARVQHGHEPAVLSVGSFPLHLSSPALRLLLEQPEEQAVKVLNASKRRYGWERPTDRVPASPAAVLNAARKLLRHDCLVLEEWQGRGRLSAAIPLVEPASVPAGRDAGPTASLALAGTSTTQPIETLLLLLQEGRHAVEAALREDN